MVNEGLASGKLGFHYNLLLSDEYYDKNLLNSALRVTLRNSEFIDNAIKSDYYYSRRIEISSSLSNILILLQRPQERIKYYSKEILYIYAEVFLRLTAFYISLTFDKYRYNLIRKGEGFVIHFVKTFDPGLFDKECDEDDYETKNLTLINYYYLKSQIEDNPGESILKATDIYMNIFDKLTPNRQRQFNTFVLLLNMYSPMFHYDSLFLSKRNDFIDFVLGRGVISHEIFHPMETNTYLSFLFYKMSLLDSRGILEYVTKYSDKTNPEYTEGIKNISYACVYFKEKSFGKCLEHLSKKDSFSNPEIKLYRNALKLCCLYELSYFENVLSEIDSTEHFLRKNKFVSERNNINSLKFVNCLKKLIKIKIGESGEPDTEMKEILESTQNLQWGYWFKEKVNELECWGYENKLV
jgi:hypothetical protein